MDIIIGFSRLTLLTSVMEALQQVTVVRWNRTTGIGSRTRLTRRQWKRFVDIFEGVLYALEEKFGLPPVRVADVGGDVSLLGGEEYAGPSPLDFQIRSLDYEALASRVLGAEATAVFAAHKRVAEIVGGDEWERARRMACAFSAGWVAELAIRSATGGKPVHE